MTEDITGIEMEIEVVDEHVAQPLLNKNLKPYLPPVRSYVKVIDPRVCWKL